MIPSHDIPEQVAVGVYKAKYQEDVEAIDIPSVNKSECKDDGQQKDPPKQSTTDSDIEDIFSAIGVGRWNIWFIMGICLTQASAPTMYYQSVFTNMPTNFRCENGRATEDQNNIYDNSCRETKLLMKESTDVSSNSSEQQCLVFEYDNSLFNSTFSTEFNLVCDRAWISQLFQLLTVIGSLLGNLITGFSDTYGRSISIKMSSYFYLLGCLMIGFGPSVYIVLLGRFLVGFWYPMLCNASYALLMETTSVKYRSILGILVFLPYDISTICLGASAFYIRHWRSLHLLVSFPVYLLPLVAMFISESPRWLIQKGYYKEAYSILKYAATENSSKIALEESMIQVIQEKRSTSSSDQPKTKGDIFKTLFASSKMTQITLITFLAWFLMAVVYFGVTLNANNFTTNPFMYIVMNGCLSFPSDAFGFFIVKKIGNIKTYQVSSLIIGACILILLGIPESIFWVRYIFVGIPMLLGSLLSADCFIISSEVFPTVNRSMGSGLCMAAYFLGFFFALIMNQYLVDGLSWGFNVVCGLCSIIAFFIVMILPETQGKPLCETVVDVDNR